ncbi:hypothetical protein H4S01_001244 [Coemansia sp. RSA 2610]|nr:hypothetical protein H4S01_001244 [Coemansia sp. RSA 2610]
MAGFSDLEPRIVARIINTICFVVTGASARLRTHRELVRLASVSRAWHDVVQPHMQSIVIIECQIHDEIDKAQPIVETPPSRQRQRRAGWKPTNGSVKRKPTAQTQAWKSNIGLLRLLQRSQMGVQTHANRLRLQSFDCEPDFAALGDALDSAGFVKCGLDRISTLEIMDLPELRAPAPVLADPPADGLGAGRAARYLVSHVPGVRTLTSAVWDIGAPCQRLAAHLACMYLSQLQALAVQVSMPIAEHNGALARNLTTLHIAAGVLARSGHGIIPAGQLQVLKLYDADAFFSWAPFACDSDTLTFSSLTALAISFASDDVRTTADFYASRKGREYSVHVTMGRDRRRIAFPRLQALSVRRLPYTYSDAWRMFAEAPLRRLAVSGPYAHVRYVDQALLAGLDVVDIHTVTGNAAAGNDQPQKKFGGRFTGFVRQLLAHESAVASAWLRHAEPFPLSVPQCVRWPRLAELCVGAYMPALALLALCAQLPALRRVVVQRIALDSCEDELTPAADCGDEPVWRSVRVPDEPASRGVRELQVHMGGGSTPRVPTLLAICCLVANLPGVRRLAVKHVYAAHVRAFLAHAAATHPELASVELVRHVYVAAKSPFAMLE